MTDINYRKKNKITGAWVRMSVKNVEKAKPEVQQAIQDIIKAIEYPKQTNVEDWEEKE